MAFASQIQLVWTMICDWEAISLKKKSKMKIEKKIYVRCGEKVCNYEENVWLKKVWQVPDMRRLNSHISTVSI